MICKGSEFLVLQVYPSNGYALYSCSVKPLTQKPSTLDPHLVKSTLQITASIEAQT